MITQAALKRLFTYCPESGEFTWNVNYGKGKMKGSVAGRVSGNGGYIVVSFYGETDALHRLAFLYMDGEVPAQVDHINGIRVDNRWSNLRECNHTTNARNRTETINNLGVTGIRIENRHYAARIQEGGKANLVYWGRDFFEACCARKSAELRLGYTGRIG